MEGRGDRFNRSVGIVLVNSGINTSVAMSKLLDVTAKFQI